MPRTIYTVAKAAIISSPWFAREFLKAAAVPWKAAPRLSGILSSRCALSMATIALPSAAPGARLNDTVTTGNWPCRLMESGEDLRSKCANAFKGTALAALELLVRLPVPAGVGPMPVMMALGACESTAEDGVYLTGAVSAFDPAETDPEAAKVLAAPGPSAPEDV